ncbi:hypothetical protein LEP1GSC170_5910 [Leptospira interrogans serovar Bataviae str. HAI135]|nr:hypothetical protein LEP1GSC170_5910 [Leptospira interrogans serovar Bataviae str. HAI135]
MKGCLYLIIQFLGNLENLYEIDFYNDRKMTMKRKYLNFIITSNLRKRN